MDDLQAKFYCDESGYTGTNWADPQQPVFAHGGWLVFVAEIPALEAALARLRKRVQARAPELKWAILARRDDPSAEFLTFFEDALTSGCIPCFQLVDKEYFIATKAVESYFDPAYNSRLPIEFTRNFTAKAKIAETLLSLPSALETYAGWLRSPGQLAPDDIRQLGFDLAGHLERNGKTLAARTLLNFTDEEIADIAAEFQSPHWQRNLTGHTLIAVLQHVQKVVGRRNVEVEIIHDNITNFEGLLDMARALFRSEDARARADQSTSILHVMPSTTGLTLADSAVEAPLQAADLLTGYLRDLLTRLKAGEPTGSADAALATHLFVLGSEFDCWGLNVPRALRLKYASLVAPPPNPADGIPGNPPPR